MNPQGLISKWYDPDILAETVLEGIVTINGLRIMFAVMGVAL